MNKKEFIESTGATCKNWNWSWSYVNEAEKTIIFGAWECYRMGDMSMILGDWKFDSKGKRKAGYTQALEHIELIMKEGYTLKIFYMLAGEKNDKGDSATILGFEPILREKKLHYINQRYWAID